MIPPIQRNGLIIILLWLGGLGPVWSQAKPKIPLFRPAPGLHQGRFWTGTISTGLLYTGTVIGLSQVWYRDYPRTGFHTFNDWGEWENVDKMGHLYTAYFESRLSYGGLRWAGVPEQSAAISGAALGLLFQTTIEVLDAYSAKWGFSWYDMGFNALGSGIFLAQQLTWHEQRVAIKFSTHFQSHPDDLAWVDGRASDQSLHDRAGDLFGSSAAERLLKDYNAQTYWVSFNVPSLLDNNWPAWMNVAIGFGAENMYGGFENSWRANDRQYAPAPGTAPRYTQWYLSPDIDFSRIPVKSPFLKTLLEILNVVKCPAPALEWQSRGGLKGHWLFF